MQNLPAIILVGGFGTRLRDLYPDRPKALVPILGRPFAAWLVDWLRSQGITRLHFAAGYRADQIADWAAPFLSEHLTLSREEKPLGTGGGLRTALERVAGAELLALNGDSFLPSLKLTEWIAEPMPPEIDGEIAVTRVEERGRYGTVEFDPSSGRITAFLEKAERNAGWVNGGVYRLRRRALESRPTHTPFSLEQDFFPALAREGKLRAVPVDPPLLDMGTPEGLHAMEEWMHAHPLFLQQKPPESPPPARADLAQY